MGWDQLQWRDHEEAAQELVFLWWMKHSAAASEVLMELESIRLGTLA